MTLNELNKYFNSFLKTENFPNDISLNGIQIQNREPNKKQIKKVAFAVDACLETAKQAKKIGADVLFVHHGIFWGQCQTLTGSFYSTIQEFINNDIALIAYHIPLDANNPNGNNYGIAKKIGLTKLKPFGIWRKMPIGVKGTLKKPMSIEELGNLLISTTDKNSSEKNLWQKPQFLEPQLFNFGKDKIKTVGIISGGAGDDVNQAVEEELDAFITGEFPHESFHFAKNNKINVIAGGHYQTETFGINLVMNKLTKDKKIMCEFIDCPTGL